MHVISERALRLFWARHPAAEVALRAWHRVVEHSEWRSFADVRATYASADQVGKLVVFNLGGNKYRLIAHVHFNRARVYVRHVLTHAEYNRGD
ncbi:MAG: type II toxin-antitoxin system HigB family toxin [Gemmataceae bacterium]|nr:type II toxin-antitoxin system HigB family toxin [Gemmataceae bacterium]